MSQAHEPSFENTDALFDLVDRYIHESLSDEEFKQLEQALQNNRSLRDYYRQATRLDANLGTLADTAEQDIAPPLSLSQQKHQTQWYTAVAAIIILTFICGYLLIDRWQQEQTSTPLAQTETPVSDITPNLAVLTHAINAQWTGDQTIVTGSGLGPQRLQAQQGLFQIDFHSGVTMVAQAPLDLELIDPMQVHCRQGTLRLRVPYHARGFKIHTQDAEIVDKGTEFGMTVQDNRCDLHVFDGEVIVNESQGPSHQLLAGQAWTADPNAPRNQPTKHYPGPEEVVSQQQYLMTEQYKQWSRAIEEFKTDTSMRLLYSFDQPWGWDRRLINRIAEKALETEGVLIGSRWTEGRWPGKRAIEFKQATDSIRIHDDRSLQSLTLMAWIRIDGFDREYNSLMTSDGWEPGCIHWHFLDTGQLDFGIMYPIQYNDTTLPVLGQSHLGRWLHLAITFDHSKGIATHYLNGTPIPSQSRTKNKTTPIPPHQQNTLRIGSAQLGNWNTTNPEIRNLNGRMDFFALWSRTLTLDEIKHAYSNGKP